MEKTSGINKLYNSLIIYSFIFLFPVLQAYSIARSLGLPSLYLPIVLYLLLFLLVTINALRTFKQNKVIIRKNLLIPSFLLIYVIVIILYSYFNIREYDFLMSQYYATLQTGVVYSLLAFIIGVNITRIIEQIYTHKKTKRLVHFSFLLLFGVLAVSVTNNFLINNQIQMTYSVDYLSISDGVAISVLVLTGLNIFKLKRYWIILMAIIIVSLTISRGGLLALIGAYLSFYTINLKLKPSRILGLILFIFVLIGTYVFFSFNIDLIYNIVGRNRGSEILIGLIFESGTFLQNDPSMISRGRMLETGLMDLKEVWFLGEFMRAEINGIGYIHNWVSFWHNYGVVPFISFIACYIVGLIKVIREHRANSTIFSSTIILLSFYTLFQIIFFRAYVYSTIWLSLGAILGYSKSLFPRNIKKDVVNSNENTSLDV